MNTQTETARQADPTHQGLDPTHQGLASRIRLELAAVEAAGKQVIQHAIAAGHLLKQAKTINKGAWLTWLKANCDIQERTAQRYMYLADNEEKLRSFDPTCMSDWSLAEAERALKAPADEAATDTPASKPNGTSKAKGKTGEQKNVDRIDKAIARLLDVLMAMRKKSSDTARAKAGYIVQQLVDRNYVFPEELKDLKPSV